jgi:hypothetical protein
MSEVSVEPSILSRDYNALMPLVYEAWTQENHLCNWQLPNGN